MNWGQMIDYASAPSYGLKNPTYWIGVAMIGANIGLAIFEIVVKKMKALVGAV